MTVTCCHGCGIVITFPLRDPAQRTLRKAFLAALSAWLAPPFSVYLAHLCCHPSFIAGYSNLLPHPPLPLAVPALPKHGLAQQSCLQESGE